MRLTKFKPLRGWRAFLGEIGVIVIGVLIALVAQAIVEDWNWRKLVADETVALDREVKDNHAALLVRVMMQPCIDRRLAELGDVFRRRDAGQPIALRGPVGRPTTFTGGKAAFAMATADQALAHMPMARRQNYYGVYSAYDTFTPAAAEERAYWRDLQALDRAATLDREDWRALRKAYDAVVDSNSAMKANLKGYQSGQWLTPFNPFPLNADERGLLKRTLLSLPYVQRLCRPIL